MKAADEKAARKARAAELDLQRTARAQEIARRGADGYLVSAAIAAKLFELSATTLIRLHDLERAPGHLVTQGPRGRRRLRFDVNELRRWFTGRRERQVRGTLDGQRFARAERRR